MENKHLDVDPYGEEIWDDEIYYDSISQTIYVDYWAGYSGTSGSSGSSSPLNENISNRFYGKKIKNYDFHKLKRK